MKHEDVKRNKPKIETIVIDEAYAGKRVDVFLASWFNDYSRSNVQRLIKEGWVLVNGNSTRQSYLLKEGDCLRIEVPLVEESQIIPQPIPLDIIYEDEDLLLINKPKGMVVHPAPGHSEGTLVNALMYYCSDLSGIGGILRPGIVHRLDKDTSGLLIVAKHDRAHHELSRQLKEREMKREYMVLVWGRPRNKFFKISAPIARNPRNRKKMAVVPWGKEAVTYFRVLARLGRTTLMRAKLETGRTHQVRVHLSYNGLPVVGDILYGGYSKELEQVQWFGQALHARKLTFMQPSTGETMNFFAPLPEDFRELLYLFRNN